MYESDETFDIDGELLVKHKDHRTKTDQIMVQMNTAVGNKGVTFPVSPMGFHAQYDELQRVYVSSDGRVVAEYDRCHAEWNPHRDAVTIVRDERPLEVDMVIWENDNTNESIVEEALNELEEDV